MLVSSTITCYSKVHQALGCSLLALGNTKGAVIVAAIVLSSSAVGAQELLPNPSFENGETQCDFTSGTSFFPTYVWGWSLPTRGTTDIFSTAISNKYCWASMPPIQNPPRYPDSPQIGNQMPRTGARFIGMFTLSTRLKYNYYNEAEDTTYREYIRATLISPLIPGEYYCGEMYVSLAETPRYAANNLGMYFHDEDKWQRNWISTNPQVVSKEVILDQVNWKKISGAFKATSPARYLTIGNFFSYADTEFVDKGGAYPDAAYTYNYAYYFIDDVSVKKLESKTFSFNGNTTICEGELASVKIEGGLESIFWTTLSDTATVLGQGEYFTARPLSTTSYLVKGRNCGLDVKDTLEISVKPAQAVDIGGDQVMCAGTTRILDAGEGFASYTWQDGSAGRFFAVTESGYYNVRVENENGCAYTDAMTMKVEDIPTADLGGDTLVCGRLFKLKAAEFSSGTSYLWSTGSISNEILPTEPGIYYVTVKNTCGESSDTVTIYSPDEFTIPNVVTINDDQLNEKFVVKGELLHANLVVYNRWGTPLWQSDDYRNTWPESDDDLSPGLYYYTLTYPGCKTYNGWIQVMKN